MTIQAIKDKLPELQTRLSRMEARLGGLLLKREKAERAYNLLKNKEVIMLERLEKMRAKIAKINQEMANTPTITLRFALTTKEKILNLFQKIKNCADREEAK